MPAAFNFIMDYHDGHFALESDYEYAGMDGYCLYDDVPHVGSLSSYTDIVEGDEDDLEAKVQIGPASVGIGSSPWYFLIHLYKVKKTMIFFTLCISYNTISDQKMEPDIVLYEMLRVNSVV